MGAHGYYYEHNNLSNILWSCQERTNASYILDGVCVCSVTCGSKEWAELTNPVWLTNLTCASEEIARECL